MGKREASKVGSYLFVLAAATLWGTVGVFIKALSAYGFTRPEIVFFRAAVSVGILLVFLLITDRSLLKIRLRDLWMFFCTGIVSLFGFNFCYFTAIELTSLSVAAVLLYTAPAFVVVLSALFFHEHLTRNKIIALLLTLPGCAIVSGALGNWGAVSFRGILFGLGAGFGYALYTVFSRVALGRYGSLTVCFYTFLFAAVGAAFFSSPAHILTAATAPRTLLLMLGISIATSLLPNVFYTRGMTGIGNGEASVTATLEPVVATLIGISFFKEGITLEKLCGMALILGAVILISREGKTAVAVSKK